MIAAAVVAIFLGGIDPCAPIQPAAERDPASAALYFEVAEAERAAGRQESAIAAFRIAASLDSERPGPREALAQLCAASTRERDLGMALEHVRAGRHREALEVLERLASHSPSPDVSLLAGASYVQLGEYAKARQHLALAGRDPALADSANVFLGIAAMREGEAAAAREYFRAAADSRDERLGSAVAELLRASSRANRLTVLARLAAGYSSNVTLTPDQLAASEATPGGSSLAGAAMLYRPLGTSGPWARLIGVYQRQLEVQLRGYDFGQAGAAAGWTVGAGRSSAQAEYAFDVSWLGNTAYSQQHRVVLTGRRALGALGLEATAGGRQEGYARADLAEYSGPKLELAAAADVGIGRWVRAGLGWRLHRAWAARSELGWLEHGPAVHVVMIAGRFRGALRSGVGDRRWTGFDPDLATYRRDTTLSAALEADLLLDAGWTVHATIDARRVASNVASLSWSRAAATVGLSWSGGVL